MTAYATVHISSRDNALLKDLRRIVQDGAAYRKQGRVWLEGDHLCRAALVRGWQPEQALFSARYWPLAPAEFTQAAARNAVVADGLWAGISALESPAQMGFVMVLPAAEGLHPLAPTVILDRLQDPGNVGSILRSAGAFGFGQVIALKGTVALWSPKVLRAGMGAHFGLRLIEGLDAEALNALQVPMVVTSSHSGELLHRQTLPSPCAWVLGHEGQGISPALAAKAQRAVRIAQPGGEESLNVAAAAAVCLHASAAQL